ncbi:hypothetical protein GCM10009555_070030 [Acrocarpospora macrocephala]|uniref:Major facilitator superfamily (MFS) profile domain-containing protein n=1 Tax=Acrocarpospora macrocephala TaxID=150177 RepID=A0A5M3WVZ1_9ACTN|nr:MFS transporter [Acrocarpospora macrocephala]GES13084.1 hypothetical protein Amac_066810 [Acrocarpospora macrocephala]
MSRLGGLAPIMGFSVIYYTQLHMTKPFVPLYAASAGAGLAGVGVVAAAGALLPIFIALPVGILADRRGTRTVLVAGSALSLAALLLLATGPGLALILVAQLLAGAGQLMTLVASQSRVAGLSSGRGAERSFSVYTMVASVGQILGPLGGGFLVTRAGYPGMFLFAAGLALLALTAALIFPKISGTHAPPPRQEASRARILWYLRDPPTRIAILMSCLIAAPDTLRTSLLPVYLETAAQLTVQQVGYVLSLFSITGLFARLLMPLLADRLGPLTLMAAIGVVVAVVLAAIPFTASVAVLAVLVALLGLAFGMGKPLSMALVVNEAQADELGLVVALRVTGNRVTDFVAPLCFGFAAAAAGVGAGFGLGAALIGLGTIPLWWRRR